MASLKDMRERNRLRVLQALRVAGAADRAELARLTGLSRATVSGLVGDAVAQGHVVEAEPSGDRRRATMLQLDPRAGLVAGVDLGHRHVRVVLADLAAAVVGERSVALDVDAAADVALDTAASLLEDLVRSTGVERDRLVGIGLGIPGPVDRETGTVRSTSILTGWAGVHPADELRRRVGVPVRVENDGNLGALGEHLHGAARGDDDLFYVKLATGVGGGAILGGALYVGARGAAAELGHVTVVPHGGICRCGNRGCLELVASSAALSRTITGVERRGMTIAELAELDADAVAVDRAVGEAGRHVGRAVAPLCIALDVPLVVVGGDLGAAAPRLVGAIRSELRKASGARKPVQVRAGRLGGRAEVLGAVALALGQGDWLGEAGLISLVGDGAAVPSGADVPHDRPLSTR
jgi:predicted NBD/HSP70 family sugar kinase